MIRRFYEKALLLGNQIAILEINSARKELEHTTDVDASSLAAKKYLLL